MVMLGIANSRMKDFYDVWILARQFEYDGVVAKAIKATFDRRKTELPASVPLAMTAEFSVDNRKQTQWKAFLRKGKLADDKIALSEVTEFLKGFLMPPTSAAIANNDFKQTWKPGGPWTIR